MAIKILTKKQEQDIHVGLSRKIKYNRMKLNRWVKDNPEHPDKIRVISEKAIRIRQLEELRSRFATPSAYEL